MSGAVLDGITRPPPLADHDVLMSERETERSLEMERRKTNIVRVPLPLGPLFKK